MYSFFSQQKETMETKLTKSKSEIGSSKKEILQIKNRKNLEHEVYSREKSLEEIKTSR